MNTRNSKLNNYYKNSKFQIQKLVTLLNLKKSIILTIHLNSMAHIQQMMLHKVEKLDKKQKRWKFRRMDIEVGEGGGATLFPPRDPGKIDKLSCGLSTKRMYTPAFVCFLHHLQCFPLRFIFSLPQSTVNGAERKHILQDEKRVATASNNKKKCMKIRRFRELACFFPLSMVMAERYWP